MIKLSTIKKLADRRTLTRYVSDHYSGEYKDFVQDIDLGINALLQTDLRKAKKYIDGAEILFRYLPEEYEPRRLAIRGRYHLFIGEYKKAVKYYKRGVDVFKRAGNAYGVARLGKGLLEAYSRSGMYQEALETGKNSLRYFQRKKLSIDVAHVCSNLGNVYHRMDNNRMALRYYDKAGKVYPKKGDYFVATVEFNRANIFANLNRIKEARQLYSRAATTSNKIGWHVAETRCHYALAFLLFLEEKFTESIKLFERVYERAMELANPIGAANALLDMAEIEIQLNQYGSAIMLADQVIPEFQRMGLKYEEAKANYFASDALLHLGDYEPAARRLKKAERIFRALDNKLWLGMVSIARCKLYMARGRYQQAIQAATDSRTFFLKSHDERRTLDAEIILIEAVCASGDYNHALKLAQSLKKRKLIGYQEYRLSYIRGKCYFGRDDYSEALKHFKKAVRLVEKMLSGLYPDEIRFFFLVDKYDSYRMLIECQLKLGRVSDSFISNLKALEIINHRTVFDRKLSGKVGNDLIEKRNELRAALKKLNQSPRGGQRGSENLTSYYSIEQKLWTNERKIRTVLYPRKLHRERTELKRFDNIFQHIGTDDTIVSFFSSENLMGAYCAAGGRVNFVQYDISSNELDVLLRKIHFIFENAVFGHRDIDRSNIISEHYLSIIYQKIIEPLLPFVSGRKIIFMADSGFGQIPFMALKDRSGEYIKDKFEFRIIVNPEDISGRETAFRNLKKCHNAIFASSSDLLPLIDIEARQIKNIYGKSKLYLEDKASCINLTSELKEADGFVHIAAHASRSSENPLFSRILMNDGPFFPFDLFQSGVRAELVTLSGCQTAAPGLYYGNSFSLAKAFYQAGSHHVLATLWPVSDKLSMLFMINFYETLANVGNVYFAYQSAVNQIKTVTDNPAFWSSFVLLGT